MNMKYQNKMVRETLYFWKASMMDGELERSWKQNVTCNFGNRTVKEVTGDGPILPAVFPKLDGISHVSYLGFTILQQTSPCSAHH